MSMVLCKRNACYAIGQTALIERYSHQLNIHRHGFVVLLMLSCAIYTYEADYRYTIHAPIFLLPVAAYKIIFGGAAAVST
jgi:hypothetical protein